MAGNLAVEPKKRIVIAPMAIVASVVVLIGLVGFWLLDRASKQPPAGPAPLTGDAKAYVKYLRFVADDGVTPESPKMEMHENILKQGVVEITGNLLNSGDRVLNAVEINWVFHDPGAVMPDGQLYQDVIWRQRTFVVTRKAGGLEPGKARAFRVAFDDVPDAWNQALPTPVIAAIEFR